MDINTVQQTAQASDNLITIIAGFFLVFTTFIKVLTEIHKIKLAREKTALERDQRFKKIEKKIGLDSGEENADE